MGPIVLLTIVAIPLLILAGVVVPELSRTVRANTRLPVPRPSELVASVHSAPGDPHAVTYDLLVATFRITIVSSVFGIVSGLLYLISDVLSNLRPGWKVWLPIYLLGSGVSLLTSFLILRIARQAIRKYETAVEHPQTSALWVPDTDVQGPT